jgi:hypothetical protein
MFRLRPDLARCRRPPPTATPTMTSQDYTRGNSKYRRYLSRTCLLLQSDVKMATTGPETTATVNASLTPVPLLTTKYRHSHSLSLALPLTRVRCHHQFQISRAPRSRTNTEAKKKKPHRVSVARFGCFERRAVQCREVRRGTPSRRRDPEDCRTPASAILIVEGGPLAFFLTVEPVTEYPQSVKRGQKTGVQPTDRAH